MSTKSTHDYPLLLTYSQAAKIIGQVEDISSPRVRGDKVVKLATKAAEARRTRLVVADLKANRS